MKTAEASLNWSLWVECPYCECELDLSDPDYDDEGQISNLIFNNKSDELSGTEVECQVFFETFSISSLIF